MRVYISGPMTGLPNYNYDEFYRAANLARMAGHDAINPADHFSGDQSKEYHEYMRADIGDLLTAEAVYFLKGWRDSIGARVEYIVAVALNLPIAFEEELASTEDGWTRNYSAKKTLRDAFDGVWKERKKAEPSGSVLTEAEALVHGDRGEAYGHPFEDFSKTAKIWETILGCEVTAEQVALCMIGVKISRQLHKPKRDNAVDIAGYAETLQMCVDYRANLN